jgi:predicted nucleotidyltransferase
MDAALTDRQRALVDDLAHRLIAIDGVAAVVLGGSFARGRARPESDIDLGVLYSERAPFAIEALRALAAALNDTADPVVADFYEWGPWVNGGAWLTVRGQRVDLLYRSVEHLERAIADADAGRWELHFGQQAPFGFFSATYLGELVVCLPLADPTGRVAALKRRVATYPEALRTAVVRDALWQVEFGLAAFARKFATRGDVYGTVGCLARAAFHLVLALFALNRTHLLNDKTALEEIAAFPRAPRAFGPRTERILAHAGASAAELGAAVDAMLGLCRETAELSDGLYVPRYALPGSSA